MRVDHGGHDHRVDDNEVVVVHRSASACWKASHSSSVTSSSAISSSLGKGRARRAASSGGSTIRCGSGVCSARDTISAYVPSSTPITVTPRPIRRPVSLDAVYSGKVRDIYDAGDGLLLFVASDRLSIFDVVLGETVPDKGRVLTAMSTFWFDELADVLPNHVVATELPDLPAEWVGRVTLARRAEMLKIECIVRGYLSGSAWKEYEAAGTMHGLRLPSGLRESQQLPEPVFTPSTKAEIGDHDVNISFEDACEIVGAEVAARAREASLELYRRGAAHALERGIVIADAKFELGFVDGQLVVADELLTQDSSRFWPADQVTLGRTPPSFDKQPVRDYAESLGWDKTPPAPPMPADVIAATRVRYIDAYERITGLPFSAWPQG